MLKEIRDIEFEKEVLKSEKPVLVDFWATWCGPCKMMTPVLEEISKKFEGKLNIIKINIEEKGNDILSLQYGVMSIPNMKLFKNGKIIKEFVGFRSLEEFTEELKQVL